jgi:hypothetical protein
MNQVVDMSVTLLMEIYSVPEQCAKYRWPNFWANLASFSLATLIEQSD